MSYQPEDLCSGFDNLYDFGKPFSYAHRGMTLEEAYRRGENPFRELVYHGHVPNFVRKLKAREDLNRLRPGHANGTLETNETLRRQQEVQRDSQRFPSITYVSLNLGGLADHCRRRSDDHERCRCSRCQ